jgi:hypothetical protein
MVEHELNSVRNGTVELEEDVQEGFRYWSGVLNIGQLVWWGGQAI